MILRRIFKKKHKDEFMTEDICPYCDKEREITFFTDISNGLIDCKECGEEFIIKKKVDGLIYYKTSEL